MLVMANRSALSTMCSIIVLVVYFGAMAASRLGWLPDTLPLWLRMPIDNSYTGVVGNLAMFVVGFGLSSLLPKRPRDLRNLSIRTQDATPLD